MVFCFALLCFSPNCPWLDPRETWNLVTLTANQTNSGAMTSQAGLQRPWDLTGLSQEREGRREAAASTCPGSAHLALLLSINWLKLRSKFKEIRFGANNGFALWLTEKWGRKSSSEKETGKVIEKSACVCVCKRKCVRVCVIEKVCVCVR